MPLITGPLEITDHAKEPVNTQRSGPFRSQALILSLALIAATLFLYLPALNNGFVNYDDPDYVTANAHIRAGLSPSNVIWSITAISASNWHPVTWVSHMADIQFFGLNPRGHHLVSIGLHALNVALLFIILFRGTQNLWRSALVAALFAVHPLNVECVAWIAERKSVLSMFFMLLAFRSYEWYAQQRRIGRYLLIFFLFALALSAKAMVVTFPFLLLLWDYWPLGEPKSLTPADRPKHLRWVAEKLPLIALSALCSWITVYAQRVGGALGSTQALPMGMRIKNGFHSYATYLLEAFWPTHLAVFYPHTENSLATGKVAAFALLIAALTTLVWVLRKRRYLLVGWLWFLGAMVPMIGIVQAGKQGMADRYAYLPLIGLFIVVVWGTDELLSALRVSKAFAITIALALLFAYSSASYVQLNYWRNSYTLFSHAVQVTRPNPTAETNLGEALVEMGRPASAQSHFEAAIDLAPQSSTPHYDLAVLMQRRNQLEAAKKQYELALAYGNDPLEMAQSHNNLGLVLSDSNEPEAAIAQFSAALQIDPNRQNSLIGRGMVQYRQGNKSAALSDFSRAADISPTPIAELWLGRTLSDMGQPEAASNAYRTALHLAPGLSEAQQGLDELSKRPH